MKATWIELYDHQTRRLFYVNQEADQWSKDKPLHATIVKADLDSVWSIWNDESQMPLYYSSRTMKWTHHSPPRSCTVVSLSRLVKRPSMRRYIYLPPVPSNSHHHHRPMSRHGSASHYRLFLQNDNRTTSAIVQSTDHKRASLPTTTKEASQSAVVTKIKKQSSLLQRSTESTFQARLSPQSLKKHLVAPPPRLSITKSNQHNLYLTNAQDTSTSHVQYRPCAYPKYHYHASRMYSPPSPMSLSTSSSSSPAASSSSGPSPVSTLPTLSPLTPLSSLSPLSPLSPLSQLNSNSNNGRKYVFEDYVAMHFSNHKRGLIIRTPISSTSMAQWTKNSISKPLLKSTDKNHTKDAIDCFKKIQVIMGDRSRKSHGRIAKGDDVTDIQSILTMGITGGQQVCDEIYVQLCKQLNHNPGSTSSQNGWELLSVLCSTIPPSNELALYIIQLLNDIQQRQPASTQSGSSITTAPSPLVTSYLSLKLRRICQKGAHGKVPCRAEIERDRMAILHQQDPEGAKGAQAVTTMVFGTPLDIIMKNQQRLNNPNNTTHQRQRQQQQPECLKIPRIVPFLIHAIRQLGGHFTQGVFRISGLAELVTALRLQIESGVADGDGKGEFGNLDLDICCGDPNVPASLLRIWLRELPTPLIPVDVYNRCIDHSSDLKSVMEIVDGLPDVNRRILLYIIGFIQEYLSPQVCQRTLMTVSNLAMVFAPNFLRGPLSDNLVMALHKSKYEQLFVKTLLLGPKVDMDRQLYG
ncbi:hypothetical protein [Absidia glauca]|uniref:Rho-GAP domain-containing protein n=1 Tax=Absidia glauca TaxID=4829 RepID=A0A168SGI7_ABSGL|nr:hypothetical protein [Absidia glauca]